MVFTLDCLGRGAQVKKKSACRYHEIVQKRASISDDSLSSVFLLFPSCNVAMIQGLEYNPKGKVVFLRVLKRNQDRTSIPH